MADDPYAGLIGEFDARADRTYRSPLCEGTVLESSDGRLVVRADGMDLDQDDLLVASYLTKGWREQLYELAWPLMAQLPQAEFYGTCEVVISGTSITGKAQVTRPAEQVEGETAKTAGATHPAALFIGDKVLLLRSRDEQSYYVICKFVKW